MPIISSSSASGGTQGTEIGYDQITAPVNVVSTTEATGTTIISCAAHTFDGTPALATFFAPIIFSTTVAGNYVIVSLFEGATQIGRLLYYAGGSATQQASPGPGLLRFSPSSGSHTYTVTAFAQVTTGTPSVYAGVGGTAAVVAAFIRFTKV